MIVTVDSGVDTELMSQMVKMLREQLPGGKVESLSYSDSFNAINYSFSRAKFERVDRLHHNLNQIAHIQKINIFFNKQGLMF